MGNIDNNELNPTSLIKSSEWHKCRIKDVADIVRGGSPRPIDAYLTDDESGLNWIKIGDTKKGDKYITSVKQKIKKEGLSKTREVHAGDLLLTNSMSFGEPYILKVDGCIHDGWVSLGNLREIEKEYLYYLLCSQLCVEQFKQQVAGGVVQNLNIEKIGTTAIVLPPLEVQKSIVEYLNIEIGKIDKIISDELELIGKYEEWKQSTITTLVTKGIDDDVALKKTDIKSIGMIPKGWSICKTLYGLSMPITDGPHSTPELYNEGIPFVSAEAVSSGNGSIDFSHIRGFVSREFYDECCKKYIPQRNDIYMIKSGATTGKVSIVDTDREFTIWSPLAVFRTDESKLYYKYLYYFLISDAYQKQVQLGWTYGTQQNIGMRTLEKLKICLPPIEEQKVISTILDKKCEQIDRLITDKKELIESLTQYKQSLIDEVTAGRKEV